jgi:hypothetical protein
MLSGFAPIAPGPIEDETIEPTADIATWRQLKSC